MAPRGGGAGAAAAARGRSGGPGAREGAGAGAAGAGVCCICLEGFGEGAPGGPEYRTACGHGFHLECIRKWSRRSTSCPLCARSLALVDPGLDGTLERPPRPDFQRGDPSAAAEEGEEGPAGPLEPWEEEVALQRELEADVMLQIAHFGGGGAADRVAPAAWGRGGGGGRLGKGLLLQLWGLWCSGPKCARIGLLAASCPGRAS